MRRTRTAGETGRLRSYAALLAAQRAEGRPDVAPHPGETRSLEGAGAIAPLELVFIHRVEERLVGARERVAGPQLRHRRRLGEALIPGTHVVADVAAERVPLEPLGERLGNRPPLLDGEIGDAPGGVQHVRLDERFRWTGIEAAGAAPAVVGGGGRIRRERQVGEDGPDEEERAGTRPDE